MHESGLGFLPVRELDVVGDKDILFVGVVATAAEGEDQERGKNDE
jgi:hypothetical protein